MANTPGPGLQPGLISGRSLLPVGVVVSIVSLAIWATWQVRGEIDGGEQKLQQVAETTTALGDQVDELRDQVDELRDQVVGLRTIVLSSRRASDLAIYSTFAALDYPQDFTEETDPRPRVAAISRELKRQDIELVPTRAMIDRVWLALSLHERKTFMGLTQWPRRQTEAAPG